MAHPILEVLAAITPSILGVAAFTTGSWLVDKILSLSDEPGVDIESVGRTIIKILQFCGMAMGILCFSTLVSVLMTGYYNDPLTMILLAVIGFVLLVAPIAKFPWAAILSLIVAVAAAAIVAFIAPDWLIGLIPLKYIVIAVFIIVGIVVFTAFKWIEDLTRAFALLLASRPVTVILMILGIVQAAVLLFVPGGLLALILP